MRIDSWLKTEIKKRGYAALYCAGPIEVVPKRMGDNRGCRPILIGVTTAFEDTISGGLNRASWTTDVRVLFRLWCTSIPSAKALASLVDGWFEDHHEPMRQSWTDLGPELNVSKLEHGIRALGADYNVRTFTDQELVEFVTAQRKSNVVKLKRAWG